MNDNFISLQDISGELSRLRADKAALQRKVEELGAALQGFVDDSRGVYVRSGALVITTCESREIAIEAINSTKEAV